jgi:hypothetical protein
MSRLQLFAAALWWGSLTIVGFLVVPLLFVHLDTPAIAGQMAAKLFSAQTWVSVFCGVSLLLYLRKAQQPHINGLSFLLLAPVVLGLLLALVLEYVVTPHIVARENMALWHNLGSATYLLQWFCSLRVLWAMYPVDSNGTDDHSND